ncbi:MAG: type II secretion system inner membrane protein GspF [Desulfococcaceae bacterium]
MTIFSYKASDFSGKVVKGTFEAEDETGVVKRLQGMGYIPIQINAAGTAEQGLRLDLGVGLGRLFGRVSRRDVLQFTQDLAAMLASGLPVDRALAILLEVTEKRRMRDVVSEIRKSVQAGSYLSDAMARHPEAFSDFYVSMIRAGEAGGVLDAVLERLGEFLESSQELVDYIKSALVYPLFLVFVGGLSVIILMTYVIPRFSVIFEDLGGAIPPSTQLLLASSELLRGYWWALLPGVGLAIFGFSRYAATPSGKARVDRVKLRLPLLGELIRKIETARFARTLGTLVRSGVPILQALSLVRDTISNSVISRAMQRVHARVQEGERMSRPLAETGHFPAMAVQMITVGEESGRLEEMLLRVADNYEKLVRNLVKRLISMLEPTLILLMGVVVGFIVISMLMAIFSMNEMPF